MPNWCYYKSRHGKVEKSLSESYHKDEYSTRRENVFMGKHLNPLEKEFLIRKYKSNPRLKMTDFCIANDISISSLYYKIVVFKVPLQGLCYTVRDAVDWLSAPTARRFLKGSNHSSLQYCWSVRYRQTVYVEQGYKSKVSCGPSIK